tara:strand:- start:318 stop:998 length:681 start_codon:yes stop_codon:yes gene_type:complete
MHIVDLLPLSIGMSKLNLSKETRTTFVNYINAEFNSNDNGDTTDTWTGDLYGRADLHNVKEFNPLFNELPYKLHDYCKEIGVNSELFDFHYVRSWGTRAQHKNNTPVHAHTYAHLAAVYYPLAPEISGDLIIGADGNKCHNEIIPDLFSDESYKDLLTNNQRVQRHVSITPRDNALVIFPAKTDHLTTFNESTEIRYSIAIDILMTLKSTDNNEYCLPPVDTWRKA